METDKHLLEKDLQMRCHYKIEKKGKTLVVTQEDLKTSSRLVSTPFQIKTTVFFLFCFPLFVFPPKTHGAKRGETF